MFFEAEAEAFRFLVSYMPLACGCVRVQWCLRVQRSGLAEPRGVRAGPSVQNQTLRNLNGTSNNIRASKAARQLHSNYSGAQFTTATQFTSQISNF